MTSNLYVDVMSLLKQVITTIFYIIMIKIDFIIMTDRYYGMVWYGNCLFDKIKSTLKHNSKYIISES